MSEPWDVGLPEPEPIDWPAIEAEMSEHLGRPWKRGEFVPLDGTLTAAHLVFPDQAAAQEFLFGGHASEDEP